MIPITDRIYIFGAHSRAQNLYAYLKILFPKVQVIAFLYDNDELNADKLYQVDVLSLREIHKLDEQAQIWVAVKGIYFEGLKKRISEKYSNSIIFVTPEIDNELRNAYAEHIFHQKNMHFIKMYDLKAVESKEQSTTPIIYMVQSIYDKSKVKKELPAYIQPIQAGAALTEERIATINDNTGDTISEKNKQYCELTALYWIWKNTTFSWVGLCHYRRHFFLSEKEVMNIPNCGVDVILPVPSVCQPTIGQNYRKRHDEADWNHLLELIKEKYPEMYETARLLWETPEYGCLYYTCNMFIMKKEVLDDYCAWLFPILSEMEDFGGVKQDEYQNRYLGFLAERLMSLYFVFYKDKYRIVFVDKVFVKD